MSVAMTRKRNQASIRFGDGIKCDTSADVLPVHFRGCYAICNGTFLIPVAILSPAIIGCAVQMLGVAQSAGSMIVLTSHPTVTIFFMMAILMLIRISTTHKMHRLGTVPIFRRCDAQLSMLDDMAALDVQVRPTHDDKRSLSRNDQFRHTFRLIDPATSTVSPRRVGSDHGRRKHST